ncbi:MAG: hypothetical protein DWQ01_19660 [Planctomycetota bacterium]|nr:MAG: hypothetical protein DWQ01_19660 [Planctomycetota bacterium]
MIILNLRQFVLLLPKAILCFTIVFLILPGSLAHGQQFEVEELLASDGFQEDRFGYSVSVSDGVAVVGAFADDDQGEMSGAAYVFRKVGGAWVEEQKLIPSDGEAGDSFGIAVSIFSDLIVVGAHGDREFGDSSGAAYIFRFDGQNWMEEEKLIASDGEPLNVFGKSVAAGYDVVAIGSHQDDDLGFASGSVYLFRLVGNQWLEEQKLTASDGSPYAKFGYPVSLEGQDLMVGAVGDDQLGWSAGAVYSFSFDGNIWVEEQKLTASDGESADAFGGSISVEGDLLVIGASGDDDNGNGAGAAYVFRRVSGQWVEEQKLLSLQGQSVDGFGQSCSIDRGLIAVGAPGEDGSTVDSGTVYTFQHIQGSWIQNQKFQASDGSDSSQMAKSISFSNGSLFAGAWLDNDNGTRAGSVYLFEAGSIPSPIDLVISPLPLQGGQVGSFHVRNGNPNQPIWLAYSLVGGSCSEYFPTLNVILQLCDASNHEDNPVASGITDLNGDFLWNLTMPLVASNIQVWFQAVQENRVTPVVATSILP